MTLVEQVAADCLLSRIQNGDTGAFDILAEHYSPALIASAFSVLRDGEQARDVAQDVLFWMWRNHMHLYRRTLLLPYMITAARNHALNIRRRDRLEDEIANQARANERSPGMGRPPEAPDALLSHRDLALAIEQALMALSPRAEEMARLRWQDGRTRGEIARRLGVTTSTVGNTLTTSAHRLRRGLRLHRHG